MGSQGARTSKLTKSTNNGSNPRLQSTSSSSSSSSAAAAAALTSNSSSLSTHLAMVELKQRILTSLSKLSDRDTHLIAIDELETTIQTLQNDAVPMLLNCLIDSSSSDPKPFVKKESIRLLATLCGSHPDATGTHLVKIIAHLAKRLRDPDSGVRDACKDVIGSLSGIYLKSNNEGESNGVVSLFVRPLFEAMGENNKGVQVGASMCLGRVLDCAPNPPSPAFSKLCPRVCKFLNSPNFFAKSALLPVVGSLSQVGAITAQSLEPLLQSIHECLSSTDWGTRKAAAEALTALALHSSDLVKDGTTCTLIVLEASRFDKIKPVRDSMTEALQLWKKLAGKEGYGGLDESKASSHGVENAFPEKVKTKDKKFGQSKVELSPMDSSNASVSDTKAAGLKKKLPLADKDLNPEFFQKLERRESVEVVVPRKCLNPSEPIAAEFRDSHNKLSANSLSKQLKFDYYVGDKRVDVGPNGQDLRVGARGIIDKSAASPKVDDGSLMNGEGNWLAIQRQLLQLERQQTHLMNMLQEFMEGSHNSMATLENRVRGLERVVEDMAHDLSSTRRGGSFRSGSDGSSNRIGRSNGMLDYGRRVPFGDRYTPSEGVSQSMRSRGPPRRSDLQDQWEFHTYGASKSGQPGVRRDVSSNSVDRRSPRSEHENDQVGSCRGSEKAAGSIRLGDCSSARSVWQASKDESTLAAIRGAGENNGTSHAARIAVRELDAEVIGININEPEQDPIWTSWSNAMDAIQVGDMDTAYAEVLSTGDDSLLVKLMDRTGPVFDQLTDEVAVEVLTAVMPFAIEQNLFDLCLSWFQQLLDLVVEYGPDTFGIPIEIKRDLLFNLHDATSAIELPEDWEGATPDQLMLQLSTAWGIDLQQSGS